MRRAAYWLVPLIASGVALFIVLLLIQINPLAPKVESIENEEIESSASGDERTSWISHFSSNEESAYFYPVNEVTLKLDMGGESTPSLNYRLTVKPKSPSELAHVEEELKKSALPFSIHKEGTAMTLSVDSTDQSQLASLVTKLKTYQITADVSPYTEEK
jgi:hypothetical protein